MRKYGIEHFHIELIEETDNPEEREIYWIEQKGSFKYGYNATMGGDGRRYIDYDVVIATYKQLNNITHTAKKCNIDKSTVARILRNNNIPITSSQEISKTNLSNVVNMYTKDKVFIQSFPSLAEAARYLINNNLTNCKHTTIRTHISEVCRGKRKSAAQYYWEFG